MAGELKISHHDPPEPDFAPYFVNIALEAKACERSLALKT